MFEKPFTGRRRAGSLSSLGAMVCAAAFASGVAPSQVFGASAGGSDAGLLSPALLDAAEAGDQSKENAQEKEKRSKSPEASAERRRSRSAYGKLERREVKDLLKERFGKQLTAASATGTAVESGGRVVKRIGDHGAAVISPSGQRSFITSTAPLSAVDAGGDLVPLDLSLAQGSDGWRPARSAVDVLLPNELGDGLRLLGGSVALRLDATSSALKVEGHDAVVYPDAVPGGAADFVAAPTASGVETFVQVRSPEAAESATLQFALPAGARLIEDGSGARASCVTAS